MLAEADDCVLCGGQGLIQGRPCRTVRQDDVQTFILFFGRTLLTHQAKTVQDSHIYQHLEKNKTASVQLIRAFRNIPNIWSIYLWITFSHTDTLKPKQLNRIQPSLIWLFTPVLFKLWHVSEKYLWNHPCARGNKVSISICLSALMLNIICYLFY